VSAESHRALFDRAADQLVASKVLLPGASALWRLVGAGAPARSGTQLVATDEARRQLVTG